eukprot:756307-Hanusia_phi.AAC.4
MLPWVISSQRNSISPVVLAFLLCCFLAFDHVECFLTAHLVREKFSRSRYISRSVDSLGTSTNAKKEKIAMQQGDRSDSTPDWDLAWKVYLLERTVSKSADVMLYSLLSKMYLTYSQWNRPVAPPPLLGDIDQKRSLPRPGPCRTDAVRIPPIYANLHELSNLLEGMLLR